MLYIKENKQRDIYFIYVKSIRGEDKIARWFFNRSKAEEYIEDHQRRR